ncbi:hypothetical protein [Chryseobacterium camelliae]|uniref:hypothetical protein n=1 Tax=Chryseobacterium camelliae TaxID=1265445 RepID=UPI00285AF207|nr:hypothetical protein [Chryseobacterium camelliae]MDR6513925.1 hypothetical protein [Chryseobacterium camelliae]
MLKKILILLYFFPLCITAQQQEKCSDKKRGIKQLPCTIVNRYGIDMIPDEETAIKYVDILIRKRDLLDPERCKPYQINLIADNRVWEVVIKSYKCSYCKIFININKNTGEVLNIYRENL